MVLACKTVPRLFLMSSSFILKGWKVANQSQTRPVAAGQPTHQRIRNETSIFYLIKREREPWFQEDIYHTDSVAQI